MTDPGGLALDRAAAPALSVPGPGGRRAAPAARPARGIFVDPLRRRLARRRGRRVARSRRGQVTRLVWDVAAVQTARRSPRSACWPTASRRSCSMLVALVAFLVQLYSLEYLQRRAAGGARPLLHLPVAVRVLDDGPGARAESPAAVHLLGAGRPLLVPADRLLVSEAGGGARSGQGLLDDEGRRRRTADRHRHAVAAGRARSTSPSCATLVESGALPVDGPLAHHVLHLSRRRRQVGAVPAARLAARRDGRPDAGLGADSRRDDGDGGRVSAAPRRVAVRAHAGRAR